MKIFHTLALFVALASRFIAGNAVSDLDLVVVAYNSYEQPNTTLVFASADEHHHFDHNEINVGAGHHLWIFDEYGMEFKRGWMYRFRRTMQAIVDEYNLRGQEDFIALVADASDSYITKSLGDRTLDQLKHRFLHDFGGSKIVISTQVYCCNPWELRTVARDDWNRFYKSRGGPETVVKHVNAGLYMGYASALIEMAQEMKIWESDYHHHESFASIMKSDAAKHLHMSDMEVDDDEWQMSAWYIKDQEKEVPLATLDMHTHVFAVTGVFRARELDNDFVVLSRDDFYDMFGIVPDSFKESDIGKLTVCPFEYDAHLEQWTSTLTDGHPLVFHFAGNDWLCACPVFAAENYVNVPDKFRTSCEQKYDHWNIRVKEAIEYIALTEDSTKMAVLHFDGNEFEPESKFDHHIGIGENEELEMGRELHQIVHDIEVTEEEAHDGSRKLSPYGSRKLSPYGSRKLSPYGSRKLFRKGLGNSLRKDLGSFLLKLSPYGRRKRGGNK